MTVTLSPKARRIQKALRGPQPVPPVMSPTQAATEAIMRQLCELAEMHRELHEARNAEIVGIFCEQWSYRVKEIARQEKKKAES